MLFFVSSPFPLFCGSRMAMGYFLFMSTIFLVWMIHLLFMEDSPDASGLLDKIYQWKFDKKSCLFVPPFMILLGVWYLIELFQKRKALLSERARLPTV